MLVIFSLPVSTMPTGCQDFPAPLHCAVDARETLSCPVSGLEVPRMPVRFSLPVSNMPIGCQVLLVLLHCAVDAREVLPAH